jgi:hypothetical protein
MSLTHKEMTAHIRNRLKVCDIPARCRMNEACGFRMIQVFGVTHEARWTAEQAKMIGRIARVNGLTFVRGMPVDEDHCSTMTGRAYFEFYFAV